MTSPRIIIDKARCQLCGTCLYRCPANYRMIDGEIVPAEDSSRCLLCGHCVALCPHEAIAHRDLPDIPLERQRRMTREDLAAFSALIKSRRSHRHFKDTPVSRERLDHLVELCRYAPTGGNAHGVGLKIIENKRRIAELSRATIRHFMSLIEQMDDEAAALTAEGRPLPADLTRNIERHRRYRGMRKALEKGRDPIFHRAPVVVVFHASDESRTPKDDGVIAAHTMVLGATASRLGSCYIGLFTRAAGESPEVGALLGLPPGRQVSATLVIGNPRLTFHRAVPRRPLPVTWE